MNRAHRRAIRGSAKATAAVLAGRCYDFALLLRNGGRPVAVPVSETEARGFPRWAAMTLPDGVTWLAVGMDGDGRASYSLHTASSPIRALAHDAARVLALSKLAAICATRGFPMGPARGAA
jgi:hypothetical protein